MNLVALENLRTFAAAIMIAGPLLGALLAFLISNHRLAWSAACVIALAVAASSVQLAVGGGFVSAPLGLRVDSIAGAAAPIVGLAGAACVLAAGWLAPSDAGKRAAPIALALLQIAWFGWIGAALSNDLFSLFAFLQIGWLSACGLSALGVERDRAALPAAMRQLVWCAIAGIAFASGAALVRNATGSADLAEIAASGAKTKTIAAGFALMIGATASWAMIAPFNAWAPAAFGRGARLASLALASVGMVAALTALARLSLSAAIGDPDIARGVSAAIAALGALSVAIGSLQAIGARDLRRLACYAGAAQAGAILIALSLGSSLGHAAAFMHMAVQAVIALGLLGGAALMEGRAPLDAFDGFGRRAPLAGAAIAIAALCLIGAPLTLGFLSRWRLIEAVLASGWWWAAAMLIAASLAAVFYAGRLLERVYVRQGEEVERTNWRVSLAPAHALTIVAALAFGLNAQPLWRAASLAGELLVGAAR